jgi:nucleotide-binding universal stress UspA family protein
MGPQPYAPEVHAMTILVPLDASEVSLAAIPVAVELATAFGDDLLLVTVADPAVTRYSTETFVDVAAELDAKLAEVAGSLGDIPVDTDVIPGDDAAAGILDRASFGDVRMIVLATHGRTALQRWPMGSVATRVVEGATLPVLVVPAPWKAGRR